MAYTKQNTRVERMQLDVVKNGWKQVDFDLLDSALSAVSITAGGKTVTYP